MALIPTNNTESLDGGASGMSALEAALLAPDNAAEAVVAEAPAKETPAAPAKAEAAPAKAADPIAEIEASAKEDPNVSKLPIDDIADDEPSVEIPGSERAKGSILALKAEIKETYKPRIAELEQTVAEREARLLELKGSADELERLRETVKSYETEMSVVKLEKTPAFIAEVTKPFEAIQTKTDVIIETYGLDKTEVYAAFAEPDEGKRRAALKAITSGLELDVDDAVELRTLAREVQPLYNRRDELYLNADKALAELGARAEQETAAQAMARAEERSKSADLVAKRIVAAKPALRDFVSEDIIANVKDTDIDALDPQNKAYNHIAGLALPKLERAYAKAIAENDKLLDELAGYQKSGARVGGGLGSAAPGEGKPKTLLDGLLAGVNG